MIEEAAGSKWIEGIYPDTPSVLAARSAMATRLGAMERILPLAARKPADAPEYVHQLRVASRRSDAALRIFEPYFSAHAVGQARKVLKLVRKAAGRARNADVHEELLRREAPHVAGDARKAVPAVWELLAQDRKAGQKEIQAAASDYRDAKTATKLLDHSVLPCTPGNAAALRGSSDAPYVLGALHNAVLPGFIDEFRRCAQAEITDASSLHTLRIASKKLRYALEVLSSCLPREALRVAYRELVKIQTRLGRMNDHHEMGLRLAKWARQAEACPGRKADGNGLPQHTSGRALSALSEFFQERFQRNARRFMQWFDVVRQREVLQAVSSLHAAFPSQSPARERSGSQSPGPNMVPPAEVLSDRRHRRVAAIDVGTNSIRMAVAETDPAVGFRIIEDVKETTRLGSGVFQSGSLKLGAVKRSVKALRRMQSIARRHHVDALRAIGTSALREAGNGADFVKLVRRRVGIAIEVIRPQREARLAFSGVSRDFDVSEHQIAVVDTGGGSTELVFASRAVIDAIRPISLGAVRLTEIFSRPDEPGRYFYKKMRRYIDRTLKKGISRVPFRPDFIVGAGGTFTSLARVVLRDGETSRGERFPFAVRGYELCHETVAKVLDELRRMSLDERCHVAGLSAKRAEIIVAGLCIVERLMSFLRVERLVIHDGGIRDGLVAEMIDGLGFESEHPRTHPEQVLAAVARYAERMHFPREHSEHVARLALKLFDRLAALQPDTQGTWAKPAHRDLLHCAALLHDVGLQMAPRAHHKHAYDMITHAQLATLTRREIEIIANVCRYHRRRGPRRDDPGFRKLGVDDQRLVAHLAGILRVADGLDYSQKQIVTDIAVRMAENQTILEVTAQEKPRRELKRASEKADLFNAAFHTELRCDVLAVAKPPPMLKAISA